MLLLVMRHRLGVLSSQALWAMGLGVVIEVEDHLVVLIVTQAHEMPFAGSYGARM